MRWGITLQTGRICMYIWIYLYLLLLPSIVTSIHKLKPSHKAYMHNIIVIVSATQHSWTFFFISSWYQKWHGFGMTWWHCMEKERNIRVKKSRNITWNDGIPFMSDDKIFVLIFSLLSYSEKDYLFVVVVFQVSFLGRNYYYYYYYSPYYILETDG